MEVIKRLVKLMVENDLSEVSIRDGEEEISLKKAPPAPVGSMPGSYAALTHPGASGPAPAPVSAAPPVQEAEDPDAGLLPVRSPMVGTFYAASDPSSPPYVKAGDLLTPDTVVCILEAMKVFNEIKAGVAGRLERVLVANETAVEYGQPLMLVRPN